MELSFTVPHQLLLETSNKKMSHCTCEKDVIGLYFSVSVLLFFENRILRATHTPRVSDYVIESRDF